MTSQEGGNESKRSEWKFSGFKNLPQCHSVFKKKQQNYVFGFA